MKTAIRLHLAPYATLVPRTIVLYNHPKSSGVISVQGGSGHFFIPADNSDNIISWTLPDGGRKIEIRPRGVKTGETILKVYDTCLVESPPAEATVAVSSIEKLALAGPTLVMLGKPLSLRVQALDGLDRQLYSDEIFSFVPLEVQVDGTGLKRQFSRYVCFKLFGAGTFLTEFFIEKQNREF